MKLFKLSKSILLGMIIIMTCSCASNSTNTNSETATPVVDQYSEILMKIATNATKTVNNNNPAVLHKFTADPCVLVYKDTVYMYGTNDQQQMEYTKGNADNGYNVINTLNVFSSKDLVNWTDCGELAIAGRSNPKGAAKWANNCWAPAICTKNINGKDMFFLYFADSANGIGVVCSDSPTGPFTDPIGKALVSRSTPNTQGVHWLFDPAVLVDDDGKGYLYYGGGVQDNIAHPKSARCVALGDDMISLAGTPIEMDPPYLFEDSGINKINGKYYYSYCTNWADRSTEPKDCPPIANIAYMTSDNPLGPFTYQGCTLQNPGTYFGPWGNNHHWIFEFKGKLYIAYHAQIVEKTIGITKGGYRSLMINEFKVNEDGTCPIQNAKLDGVESVCNFIPKAEIPAATMHSSKNLIVTNKQTMYPAKNGGYLCLKGVDFSEVSEGAKINLTFAEGHKGGSVTFRLDNFANGEELGTVAVGTETSAQAEINLSVLADKTVQNLYIVFEGDVELVNWSIN